MSKPQNLTTKIFVDSGNPAETKQLIKQIGFLDGQTTNPSLVTKHPAAQQRLAEGKKFSRQELNDFYRQIVQELSPLMPDGSISIEVYADKATTKDEMLAQAREFFSWIPNAHIKFPVTTEGLAAAEQAIKEGIRVNITLVFTQEQAAAVYAATNGAQRGQVFVSPFVGRLDDQGKNGLDLIRNIHTMYSHGDRHVEILSASIRHLYHFVKSIELGADIITAPAKIITEWHAAGMPMTSDKITPVTTGLEPIPFDVLDIHKPWQEFDLTHPLTDTGIEKFCADWNNLIA